MMLRASELPSAHDLTSALTSDDIPDSTLNTSSDTSSSQPLALSRQPSMGLTMLGPTSQLDNDSSPSSSTSSSPQDSPRSLDSVIADLKESSEFLSPEASPSAKYGDDKTGNKKVTEVLPQEGTLESRVTNLEKLIAKLSGAHDKGSNNTSELPLKVRVVNLENDYAQLLGSQKSQTPNIPPPLTLQASGSIHKLREQKISTGKQSTHIDLTISIMLDENEVHFFEQNINYFDHVKHLKENIFHKAWEDKNSYIGGMIKVKPDGVVISDYVNKGEPQIVVASNHVEQKASPVNYPAGFAESKRFRIYGIATCSEYFPEVGSTTPQPEVKNTSTSNTPITFVLDNNIQYRVERWAPSIGQARVYSSKSCQYSFEFFQVCKVPLHFLPKAIQPLKKKLDWRSPQKTEKQIEREKKQTNLRREHTINRIKERRLELESQIKEMDTQPSSVRKNKTCFNFASFFPAYLKREQTIKLGKIDFLTDLINCYERSGESHISEVVNKLAACYIHHNKWGTVKAGITQAKTFDLLKSLGFDQVKADEYVEELKQRKSALPPRMSTKS